MKWEKKGLIYCADGKYSWAKKYAFPPTPYFITDDIIRVYVGFCDENTIGRIGYVDVLAENPSRIIEVSEKPVLDIGLPGRFDDNGVIPTTIIKVENKLYLYYVGFQLSFKVRYFMFEGLAISKDNGQTFERYSQTPIIDRSNAEALTRSSAFVNYNYYWFDIYYSAGSEWTTGQNGKFLPVYNIRHLKSKDGLHWGKAGKVCIDFKEQDEHGLARPWVMSDQGLYKMFYSIRTKSKGYRIGYAESKDGLSWTRQDEKLKIDVSPSGWDSQAISYPSIAKYKDKVYLFYCGNNCGETGFGYAVLKEW